MIPPFTLRCRPLGTIAQGFFKKSVLLCFQTHSQIKKPLLSGAVSASALLRFEDPFASDGENEKHHEPHNKVLLFFKIIFYF